MELTELIETVYGPNALAKTTNSILEVLRIPPGINRTLIYLETVILSTSIPLVLAEKTNVPDFIQKAIRDSCFRKYRDLFENDAAEFNVKTLLPHINDLSLFYNERIAFYCTQLDSHLNNPFYKPLILPVAIPYTLLRSPMMSNEKLSFLVESNGIKFDDNVSIVMLTAIVEKIYKELSVHF